ncbi:MAG: Urease operon accessory protein [Rhizobiaceae bacterium]|nr:Urease operon accessory protein [Rhizobiaceae bacterium]
MIVGNGEIAKSAAEEINAADLVVRFNDCRSYGIAGVKTDVVAVCNTGRPAKQMLGSAEWRNSPAVTSASEIWSVRDPRKFAALRGPLAISHPELDDFCDDYTEQFTSFAMEAGKGHGIIDQAVHDAADAALSRYHPAPYVVPSSGMIVIMEVLGGHPEDDIAIAGFGHVGWEWHPFAAERQLVDHYARTGRLRRLEGTGMNKAGGE